MHLPWLAMGMRCISLLVPLAEEMHGSWGRLNQIQGFANAQVEHTAYSCWHDRLVVQA